VPGEDGWFYGLTDRGPNADAPDGRKSEMVLDFVPQVGVFHLVNGEMRRVDTITLWGPQALGGENYSGLPPHDTPEIIDDVNATNASGVITPVPRDANGYDSEGLAVLPDGTFLVSDEYGPYITHFDKHGYEIGRLTPRAQLTGLQDRGVIRKVRHHQADLARHRRNPEGHRQHHGHVGAPARGRCPIGWACSFGCIGRSGESGFASIASQSTPKRASAPRKSRKAAPRPLSRFRTNAQVSPGDSGSGPPSGDSSRPCSNSLRACPSDRASFGSRELPKSSAITASTNRSSQPTISAGITATSARPGRSWRVRAPPAERQTTRFAGEPRHRAHPTSTNTVSHRGDDVAPALDVRLVDAVSRRQSGSGCGGRGIEVGQEPTDREPRARRLLDRLRERHQHREPRGALAVDRHRATVRTSR
jgi:hypothetical protein